MIIDSSNNLLKKARSRYTQTALAEEFGVHPRTVARWEKGHVPFPPMLTKALERLLELPLHNNRPCGLFTFIDLFAGIGGIRIGFEELGGECIYTSEWNDHSQNTYSTNFPSKENIAGDITQIEADSIPKHDVLLAGFPCQPFSIAGISKKNALGRPSGFECTTQGTLFFDVARIIAAKRPKAFLLENVKNLLTHDKGNTFRVIHQTLKDQLGYDVHYKVIDGKRFVPQHRERLIIVGFGKPTPFSWEDIQYPEEQPLLKSILHPQDGSEKADEIYTTGTKAKVQPKYTLTNHLWEYLQNYAAKHKAAGNGFGYGLVTPDMTSRTLSARYYKDGSEILVDQGKRKNPRRLTPCECARLMGFPDSFKIPVSDTQAYKQFSQSSVVPMIKAIAQLMLPTILNGKKDDVSKKESIIMTTQTSSKGNRWTEQQTKLAFHLYCQLPFGKLHSRNPQIIELAQVIGRTPSALAMKLVNFASLDPDIRESGRKGLENASQMDQKIWDEFHANWGKLALECEQILKSQSTAEHEKNPGQEESGEGFNFTGETTQAVVQRRIGQNFFRNAVLASYQEKCCMSNTSIPQLLVASHIVPWNADKTQRLNPRNGLCLSAIHDRAFDRGFLTVLPDMTIRVSREIKNKANDSKLLNGIFRLDNKRIVLPEKFYPATELLTWHNEHVFLGG